MPDFDATIIGAGAVGLAIASELSSYGMNILLVEQHDSFGLETSSRNSEVIHSGIYYKTGSLKAKLCLEGNRLLYEFCDKFHVNYLKTGKYIISIDEQDNNNLLDLLEKGKRNGVSGLRLAKAEEVEFHNPGIICKSAIYSPETGIIDSHGLMYKLEINAQLNNTTFAYNHRVVDLNYQDEFVVTLETKDKSYYTVTSKYIINSAGLNSDKIAEMIGINIHQNGYKLKYCKGHYFRLDYHFSGIAKNLIYPLPPENYTGLGVHLTIDLGGGLKIGPDTKYINDDKLEYSVPDTLKQKFYDAATKYIRNLKIENIYPDQSGIRPKLQGPGEPQRDFIINEESDLGFPGMVNLIGIESPGLTSCLAIAKHVKSLLK